MKITITYFIVQTFLRFNLVLEQRPSFVEGVDTLLDGLLWDTGTWLILTLPVIFMMNFISSEKQKWKHLNVPFFFVLGCVDYSWVNHIYPLGLNFFEVGMFITGFTLFASYISTQIEFKAPRISHKPMMAASTLATLTFVMFIGPWLDKHENNLLEDQLARNGIYENIFH